MTMHLHTYPLYTLIDASEMPLLFIIIKKNTVSVNITD